MRCSCAIRNPHDCDQWQESQGRVPALTEPRDAGWLNEKVVSAGLGKTLQGGEMRTGCWQPEFRGLGRWKSKSQPSVVHGQSLRTRARSWTFDPELPRDRDPGQAGSRAASVAGLAVAPVFDGLPRRWRPSSGHGSRAHRSARQGDMVSLAISLALPDPSFPQVQQWTA